MAIAESVLKIIEISLHLINRVEADKIKNEILQLRSDYIEELSKDYDSIDDARLFSMELRLSGIIQLYSAAASGSNPKD